MITTQGHVNSMRLRVRDVTGSRFAELELDPGLRVGAITRTLANRMSLPGDTAWALRDERTAAFLDDDASIGDAVDVEDRIEASLVMVPRAHLG